LEVYEGEGDERLEKEMGGEGERMEACELDAERGGVEGFAALMANILYCDSVSQRHRMYLNPTSARRRSTSLRASLGALVADPIRREDSDFRHEHASRAERRVACECGRCEDVAGAEEGV